MSNDTDIEPGLLGRIRKDFFGYVFFKCYSYSVALHRQLSTLVYRPLVRLRNIELGRGCRFIGRPIIVKVPLSKITIGAYCTIRSDKKSNLIGVNRPCIISTRSKNAEIRIGDNCGLSGATIGARQQIIIGNNVLLGANVVITDFDWHNTDPLTRHQECTTSKPVHIKDNVFIGLNSIVWKGVTIGENSVIGANSIVTRDVPANVIAAGNPCRIIKYF